MSDLEFISTISSTFIDEINKFITTFTSTIKSQFEDVETKVKAQELEMNKLREELNSKKYEEKNYTSVSVIKNQDKQIHELNNTIKTLESRLKYLEQRANSSKEPSKTDIKSISIIEDKKTIDILVEHVEVGDTLDSITNTNTDTNTNEIVEEKIPETLPEPVPVKKIVKKTSKKNSVEQPIVEPNAQPIAEPITEISTTLPEPIIEKPKRKIAIKKSVKTELPVSNDTIETIEAERIEVEPIEKDKVDAELEKEAEPIEKEKVDSELEKEEERIEKENADAELAKEKEKATTIKTKKSEGKKEKEPKVASSSVKKDKEPKKPIEVKKEKDTEVPEVPEVQEVKVNTIEVKYPDTIPHLDTVNILELDNIDYYLDEITNNVFQITPSEEIGAFIGVYDKDSKKIIKMNS